MDRVVQRDEARAKANAYRSAVSVKKREIFELDVHAGREALAQLIEECEDPALLSGRLVDYLRAPRRSGKEKSTRVMRDMGIRRADCRLRDLTTRQREIIAHAVVNGYRVEVPAEAA